MEDSKSLDKKVRKRIAHHEWVTKNRAYVRAYHTAWRHRDADRLRQKGNAAASRYYIKTKDALFEILGKNCVRCGFSDTRALQIDHINGRGLQDGRTLGYPNLYVYYTARPDIAKKTLQVLCANCNWIKRTENRESYINQRHTTIRKRKGSTWVRVRPLTIDDFIS
jgi:hypothetical protein